MPGVLHIEETGTERLVWITEIDGDEVRYVAIPAAPIPTGVAIVGWLPPPAATGYLKTLIMQRKQP